MTHQTGRQAWPAPVMSRVLIVAKRTPYEEACERSERERLLLLQRIAAGEKTVARTLSAHEEHVASLAVVKAELDRRRINWTLIRADRLNKRLRIERDFDMVVAVGGDGTVLDASHYLERLPLLGVNSAPSTSHGHFCLATPATLAATLEAIAAGERTPLPIMRLQARIDGRPLSKLALNELFVEDTAGTSRYIIQAGASEEEQMSDGIFFATGAGSTGWIRGYNCQITPVLDRRIQFLVRGPIVQPGSAIRFASGFLEPTTTISLISKMRHGKVAVDGRRNRYSFRHGSQLSIAVSAHDLQLYVDADCNARYQSYQPPCAQQAAGQ